MYSFLYVSQLYVFHSSLQLTWLTDPALMTLVDTVHALCSLRSVLTEWC